jgi:hypothetical protein
MSDQDPSVTAIVAAIESAAGGRWGVWRSDTGWWWAARTRTLAARELSAGCVQYLHADNPQELFERIGEQDRLCPARPPGSQPGPSPPGPAMEAIGDLAGLPAAA